ncbi:aminoacyl-histidine dipeptidase [Geomonas sp. RF6]|uniref:aminoacyl-histidine dipeptidase n=1 Tax=Geomonas sp. RF6 TaxID=2897342 RepID=UPI001E2C1D5C|nr:aminoacyl-histidine dipeptidase [Geomonas sp. RF6]UFS69569.1 aminoacyl-histidine dipeptidase [Geomonas sp. RF6]
MSEAIAGLHPELLWRHFAAIARIPRPSKHEAEVAAYVMETAARLGLPATKDSCGNVIVKKPASTGREGAPPICLQSHLDMVCEKNAEKEHDFLKEPIELVRKGDLLMANGTTLGADNGIGVATSLAVMEDRTLEHGPLEFLFTVEEETGLAGAQHVDGTLLESRILLNLDSEEEGAVYVGCAGGRDTVGRYSVSRERVPTGLAPLTLTLKGLRGGHSGLDIDKGLGNAIKLVNRAVLALSAAGGRLASMHGGNMRNAIPRECSAVLFVPAEKLDTARALVQDLDALFKEEYKGVEPDLVLLLAQADEVQGTVLTQGSQDALCRAIAALPHGVLHMSAEIPGLVDTSTNVAVVATTETEVTLVTSQRSATPSRLTEAVQSVQAVMELSGAQVESSDGYPGWKPNLESPILKVAKDSYRSLYEKEPEVKAIHAGLECGILGERVPGLDMISFGPTLVSVHSPEEKIYIGSVEKFWEFLLEILKR